MRSKVYVLNVDFDQVRALLPFAKGAHDPLHYFEFDVESIYREGDPDLKFLVVAYKNGADASYYAKKLENRLHELGLSEAVVSAEAS